MLSKTFSTRGVRTTRAQRITKLHVRAAQTGDASRREEIVACE